MGVSLILLFLSISILDEGGVQLFFAVRMVVKSFELRTVFVVAKQGGGDAGRRGVNTRQSVLLSAELLTV